MLYLLNKLSRFSGFTAIKHSLLVTEAKETENPFLSKMYNRKDEGFFLRSRETFAEQHIII